VTKLKSLQKIDLPRERLVKYGPKKLPDAELLAILLGSGIRGKNVLELARSIIKLINSVGTDHISLDEIKKIKGIGTTKATQIIAIIELANRFASSKPEVLSDRDIWNLCSDIRGSKREHFLALYLDTHDRVIERQIISIGTLDSSLVHPREVFEPAIRLSCASIILVHNHPSGSLEPSESDIQITQKLSKSGEILGVPVERHIIVTTSGYSSI
jgi:DNA repair protein RadC